MLRVSDDILLAGGSWATPITGLRLEKRVLLSDLGIYSILDQPKGRHPPPMISTCPEYGTRVCIRWLEEHGQGCFASCECATIIRDFVEADRYNYLTASGRCESVASVRLLFLACRVRLGMSGAPVFLADRPDVLVGFIHGNAPVNRSEAIVMDLAPVTKQLATLGCALTSV